MARNMASEKNTVEATVEEALADMKYRVVLDDGPVVLCYISGKMKLHKIKVLAGDRVKVVLDKYGGKATNRIVRRI